MSHQQGIYLSPKGALWNDLRKDLYRAVLSS
jgi:hypothetical protein